MTYYKTDDSVDCVQRNTGSRTSYTCVISGWDVQILFSIVVRFDKILLSER